MTSQGGQANSSGKNAEALIDCLLYLLQRKGYAPVSQYSFPIKTEYSNKVKVDHFILGIPDYESGLILSTKRQQTSGSADQKVEAEVRLIKEYYPFPTILIVVGDAWKPRLKQWVKRQIDNQKLINVFFRYEDVLQWVESMPQLSQKEAAEIQTNGLALFEYNRSVNGTSKSRIEWEDLPLLKNLPCGDL